MGAWVILLAKLIEGFQSSVDDDKMPQA